MRYWLVDISFYKPYEKKFTFRVKASHHLRAPGAALALFKKEPDIKGRKMTDIAMNIKVTPIMSVDRGV